MIRFALPSLPRPTATLVLGLLSATAALGPAAADEPPSASQQSRIDTERAVTEAVEPERDRGRILAELYDRLGQAPDEGSSQLIVGAIEKLWLKSGSDTIDLLMKRAIQLVNAEDLDIALEILDSVVELAPDYSEGWNQRATVYFMKRDFERSLGDLRYVLRIDPRHFKAINGLGLILQQLGDKAAALKAFRQVLKVYPHLETARQSVNELTREVEGQGI